MKFQVPEHLDRYSPEGLKSFQAEAKAEYDELLASVDQATVTDEVLNDLQALRDFTNGVDAELTSRTERANRLAEFTAQPQEPVTEEPTATPAEEPAQEQAPADPAPAQEAVTASATTARTSVSIADVAAGTNSVTAAASDGSRTAALPVYGSLIAAADVPGLATGTELADMEAVAKAFLARTSGYNGLRGADTVVSNGVATFARDYPAELTVRQDENDMAVIKRAVEESQLPGGSLLASSGISRKDAIENGASLTAAIGWCSPSTTIYDTCLQVTTDGLVNFPEVQAPRGGIRHNTGIDWNNIWNGGTNFFNYTEAQIIAGVTKPCITVDCPSFVDTRLGVTGLCVTGNILQNRAYPEYVATFIRGALAASAHQVNMLQIASVVTASTAVNLNSAPFAGDGSVVSQIFSAVDLAVTDMKYRMRLSMDASIEMIFPFWVLAQMRADWIRRNAVSNPNLADADISSFFSARNVAPQFVYDWQDSFSASGVGPGASTPITALPTSLVFLAYPAGTWVRAVSDVITLNSIYDSTKLASNQVTQLFTEQGWAMAQMCPISRAYTVAICPTGETGGQRVSSNTISC